MARSNAWRVPEPCSRTIQRGLREVVVGEGALFGERVRGRENTTSSSSRNGRDLELGMVDSSPSIRPTSISKLATRRAISSVLATSSRTGEPGSLAHEAGHQRHRHVIADRQRRADAQRPRTSA